MPGFPSIDDPREFLLLASYCGDDNRHCSAKRPCPVCLGMSNVYSIPADTPLTYVRELSPDWLGKRGAVERTIPDDMRKRHPKPKRARRTAES